MFRITAQGKINGDPVEVICEEDRGWSFTFNGESNVDLEAKLRELMRVKHPIGGTYYPKTQRLNLCSIFQKSIFFDRPADVDAYGDIEEVPSVAGRIY